MSHFRGIAVGIIGTILIGCASSKVVSRAPVQSLIDVLQQSREHAISAIELAKISPDVEFKDIEAKWQDHEEEFHEVISRISRGDSAPSSHARLVKLYKDIDVEATKRVTLTGPKSRVALAQDEGAKSLAPRALALAQQKLQSTEIIIATNPRAKEEIRQHGTIALFYANRVLNLTRSAKQLSNLEPEDLALWVEEKLFALGKNVAGDVRDQSFDDQVRNILSHLDQIQTHRQGLTAETKKLRTSVRRLSSQVQQAQPLVELDQKYARVRKLFESHEAEILRDQNRIIVRLRSIRFPMGQALLGSSNFPLLSKVQKAISLFEVPAVAVEGHTDSTGSQVANQKLSLERAHAVKEYLIANNTLKTQQITIAGFGFSRPLTSDKSPEGRAINRRIDIIITPQAIP